MKKLLFAAVAGAALIMAVPASAQVYFGAGPGGAGVRVGPLGFGVGPRYGWRGDRGYDDYAYAGDCRLVRERIVTPRGYVTYRTHRECY